MPTRIFTATADRINNQTRPNRSTIVTYARECRATFDAEPFNEVDSLILSWLSYLRIPEEILPKREFKVPVAEDDFIFRDTASCYIRDFLKNEYFSDLLKQIWSPEETLDMLYALATSPRFERIRISLLREEVEHKVGKQFGAMTYQIRPDLTYIVFKGTDKTLTGWEEDFRLCLKDPVPAQKLAAEYLSAVGQIFRGTLLVGGHSKGGNLAVYAAANCTPDVQERIQAVFTHDGPGFLKEDLEKAGFKRIQSRIQKTAPQFSIFGMLMRQETEPRIIYSYEHGILQHNAISWKTEGYNLSEYWYPNKLSRSIVNKLNNWLESLSDEDKATFIDTVFDILEETGMESFGNFKTNMTEIMPVVLREFSKLDPGMQTFLFDLLKQFLLASDANPDSVQNIPSTSIRNPKTEMKKYENYPDDIQELMRKYDQEQIDVPDVEKNEKPQTVNIQSASIEEEKTLTIQDLMKKYDAMDL